MFGYRKQNIKI